VEVDAGSGPDALRTQIMDMRMKDLLSRLVANVLLLMLLAVLGFGGWLVTLWARFRDKRT
jgi:hypothetical protein